MKKLLDILLAIGERVYEFFFGTGDTKC